MKITILISALVAISALLEYFRLVPFYLYPFHGGRTLYSFFGYPNIMAQYLIVTIFWGISILVSSETKKIRAIAIICTMLSVSALLVTFSRGAIISTIMSGLCLEYSLKAIQYQPYNSKYLRYAGNMYWGTGQIALAKDYFKKAKLLSLIK